MLCRGIAYSARTFTAFHLTVCRKRQKSMSTYRQGAVVAFCKSAVLGHEFEYFDGSHALRGW